MKQPIATFESSVHENSCVASYLECLYSSYHCVSVLPYCFFTQYHCGLSLVCRYFDSTCVQRVVFSLLKSSKIAVFQLEIRESQSCPNLLMQSNTSSVFNFPCQYCCENCSFFNIMSIKSVVFGNICKTNS